MGQAVAGDEGLEDVGDVTGDARGRPGADRVAAGEERQRDAVDGDLASAEAAQGDRRRGNQCAGPEPAVPGRVGPSAIINRWPEKPRRSTSTPSAR